ncbi:SDR family oxidoreductase [Mucilaginibacter sp.]|jgi:short-subunit dehydrogenase involved in D-alanine esterification of teichoic acids|uniref:SDR family oxidoreductase n=1 Tax=Mucilaginibacter sp. TaxID=1882438 RepID=UPI003562D876
MELRGKTVLITGGAAGIGYESAKQFSAAGARVIICGRNQSKLDKAKSNLPGIITIKCDVSDQNEIKELYKQVLELGGIDILYNNAGVGSAPLNLGVANEQHYTDAVNEMNINYLGVIRLNNLFMDMLKAKKDAAIIVTTSVLSYLPAILAPTYSATKAALRFYTESLRKHLEILGSSVKVFELLPPLVETEMTAGINEKKMSTEDLIHILMAGIKKNQFTIRAGNTKLLYKINRLFPNFAFNFLNKPRNFRLLRTQ